MAFPPPLSINSQLCHLGRSALIPHWRRKRLDLSSVAVLHPFGICCGWTHVAIWKRSWLFLLWELPEERVSLSAWCSLGLSSELLQLWYFQVGSGPSEDDHTQREPMLHRTAEKERPSLTIWKGLDEASSEAKYTMIYYINQYFTRFLQTVCIMLSIFGD